MQTISEDQKARIAAEVAARYGVQCKPDVVQVVPRGVSGMAEYEFVPGIGLREVERKSGREKVKAMIGAGVREAARKRRLAAAKAKEEAAMKPSLPKKVSAPKKSALTREEFLAQQKRAAEARAEVARQMAGQGATINAIADALALSLGGARAFCRKFCIEFPKRPPISEKRISKVAQRVDQVRAFVAEQPRSCREIADHIGFTVSAARRMCKKYGIEILAERAKSQPRDHRAFAQGVKRRSERDAAVKARRAQVADLFKAGVGSQEIAQRLGLDQWTVKRDIAAQHLLRSEFPSNVQRGGFRPMSEQRAAEIEARRAEVKRRRASGQLIAEIAVALGVTESTVQRDMRALRLPMLFTGKGYVNSPEHVEKVRAMRAREMTIREIAEALNIARSTAFRIVAVLEAA